MGCLEGKDETQLQIGNLRARCDSQQTWAKMHLTSPPSSTGGNGQNTCCSGTDWRALHWGTHEGPFPKEMRNHLFLWRSHTRTQTCTCVNAERRSWRTSCRPERHLNKDQPPDCAYSSAHGSAGWTHTDWTEKKHRLNQGCPEPVRKGHNPAQCVCWSFSYMEIWSWMCSHCQTSLMRNRLIIRMPKSLLSSSDFVSKSS